MRPASQIADRVAISILAGVAVIAALTFRDYGLGWDDLTHSQYGDLLLKFYGSGFADTRALSFVNLYKYGGGFDMAAALAAKVLPFGLFETRRLLGAVVGIIGLAATWRLGRRAGGPFAGLAALILLAACPLYYGHMFMNPKDAPFAAAAAVLLLAVARAFDEYPLHMLRSVLFVGAALGAAFGSRILALVEVPAAGIALLLIVAEDARAQSLRAALTQLGRFLWRVLPALPIAYLIMALLWPWSVIAPLNPIRAAFYFDKFFEKPWKELYDGALIAVPDMPATYLPHLFALKLPELMLVLGVIGTLIALVTLFRRDLPAPRRAILLMLVLAAFLPVVVAMITRPALYNGLRHFIFVVPPFAVLGGFAAAWLVEHAHAQGRIALAAVSALLAAGIAIPATGMVRLHPYQYAYFNPLAGGVRGADGKFMLDYWGLAFKQAADDLRARLAATSEHPPKDRHWVVAICGPQAAAAVGLGPQFETIFDQKTADFAMALGTFYCRQLRVPIIAEVRREGVVFARVYDLRGGPKPKLLTLPPP
jgi:Dolichyl-phosphate-mannose-protein mannosyltransferase